MTVSRRFLRIPLPALAAAFLLTLPIGTLAAQEADDSGEVSGAEGEAETGALVATPAATPAASQGEPGAEPASDVPEDPAVRAAVDAAITWLEFVDAGDFQGAWAAGASTLQVGLSPAELKASISDGRPSFTPPVVHTVIGFRLVKNPPNAAPGDYVVVRCRTRGEEGRTVLENVVIRREGEDWRVAGYFISREEAG